MGFALAEAAAARGAEVTLVYGSVSVPVPQGIQKEIRIESAMDLYDAMMRETPEQDVIIQAAAVCDYRFEEPQQTKIKKEKGRPLTLMLTENPDIAKAVGRSEKRTRRWLDSPPKRIMS